MDQHTPRQVQRLLYGRNRTSDLRSSHCTPWHAVAVACARNHTAAIIEAAIPRSELD
jgi:hypothetical protein